MLNLPVHGPTRPEPLLRSIKRHLYAENCSARTPHHLLIAVRQADTFLRGRGTNEHAAPRADLEAFVGVQLGQGVLGPGRVQGWLRRVVEQREVSRTACTPLGSPEW